VSAQSLGIIKGQVADESGAVIPGAKVTATGPGVVVKSVTTIADGTYTLTGLVAGDWTLLAASPGLRQQTPLKVSVSGGAQTANLVLRVVLEKQEVTVQESTNNVVNVDASSNAGALVLKGADLDALSDDPDDLEQDLQALAGPAAGPNGGQIYIDGFTGGRLPPKESIREIRINQNPFSSEYDRIGFGRIEILTKPGTDKFRGSLMFNISDGEFNSRNPFLTPAAGSSFQMPDFQTRQYGGNLSGPLSKKASFFLDFDRREIDDSAVINAQIINPIGFAQEPYSTAGPTPQRRTTVSPRVDYALTPNNTLMARYTYTQNDLPDYGIGNFALPGRAYSRSISEQTGQLTETAVLNAKWINETRFQVINDYTGQNGDLKPVLSVAGAFSDGGSGIGLSNNWQRHYELQNYTSTTKGTHSIKFGVRIRSIQESDTSENNFGGTWTFSGSPSLTSLGAYQLALKGLYANQTDLGSGIPSLFTISTGMPLATITQVDVGAFFQDDWRLKPNFTLSLGGRYETQTNIHDWTDFAPRIGFAWAPHGGASSGPFSRPKTVIRGGFGVFYDRIAETLALQQERSKPGYQNILRTSDPMLIAEYFPMLAAYNSMSVTGLSLTNLSNPAPNSPAANFLSQLSSQPSTIQYAVDKNIHAPYVAQTAIGIERQLASNTSLAVTFTNTRGIHQLLERDINSPNPISGVRPHANLGDIYNYETTGILNQNQLIVNVNTRISTKVSLFGGYFLSHALSNVPNGLPANDYDLADEYGRTNFDVRHRAMMAGSIATKWDIRLSPFIIIASGAPFNIVSPLLGPNSAFDVRPAFATAPGPGSDIMKTAYGTFDLNPQPGEAIIPRNYGQSPGSVTVNLRLSRTWSFGPERATSAAASSGGGGGYGPPGGGPHGGGGGGPRGMGGMGMRMGGMGGPDATNSTRRYSLTASINARNLLNHTNYGPINGILGSPTFGTSTSLAGGFGAETSPLNNRRLEWQLRFAF